MFCAGKRLSIGGDLQVVCLDHVEINAKTGLTSVFFCIFACFKVRVLSFPEHAPKNCLGEDPSDFSAGQRWPGDKDNDVSAGEQDEQWLLPK